MRGTETFSGKGHASHKNVDRPWTEPGQGFHGYALASGVLATVPTDCHAPSAVRPRQNGLDLPVGHSYCQQGHALKRQGFWVHATLAKVLGHLVEVPRSLSHHPTVALDGLNWFGRTQRDTNSADQTADDGLSGRGHPTRRTQTGCMDSPDRNLGLLIRRSWVRAPPPEPQTCRSGSVSRDRPCSRPNWLVIRALRRRRCLAGH